MKKTLPKRKMIRYGLSDIAKGLFPMIVRFVLIDLNKKQFAAIHGAAHWPPAV